MAVAENDDNVVIAESVKACPSCKSENWRSAQLVVLEGTSTAEGEVSGTDSEEDKKNCVARGSFIQTPIEPTGPARPAEPKKTGFFERIGPSKPTRPRAPAEPLALAPLPWHLCLAVSIAELVAVLIVVLGPAYLALRDRIENYWEIAGIICLICLPLSIFRAFGVNKRKSERSDKAISKYSKKRLKYLADYAQYKSTHEKYLLDCKWAERQELAEKHDLMRQKIEMFVHQRGKDRTFKKFEEEKRGVLNARELLWKAARVCMRCGTAYQGLARRREQGTERNVGC